MKDRVVPEANKNNPRTLQNVDSEGRTSWSEVAMENRAAAARQSDQPEQNSNTNIAKDDDEIHEHQNRQFACLQFGIDQAASGLQESSDFNFELENACSRNCSSPDAKKPSSVFMASLSQINLSYDDLSKNIDANFAEIDMETFRTEDIYSILALPTLHCGEFQPSGHGEQCASLSGSLVGQLDLESSASCPRSTSEESTDMSICRDEPLFSPVVEHQEFPLATISVDSLDYSSLEDPSLMLTCQPVKDNYTIAFQGSTTQIPEQPDMKGQGRGRGRGCMIQSDLGLLTTWSKVGQPQEKIESSESESEASNIKSHSLPNLLQQSLIISSNYPPGCVPLYDLSSSLSAHSRESCLSSSQRSMTLLKLLIQKKASNSPTPSESSSFSESSGCSITPPRKKIDRNLHGFLRSKDLQKGKFPSAKKDIFHQQNDLQLNIDSEVRNKMRKNRNHNHTQTDFHFTETNNNNASDNANINNNNNNNNTFGTEDEDNSQYFEDSLMEAVLSKPQVVNTASPIKEEAEEGSSCDETMRDSKDPFGSETSTSEDSHHLQNNTIESQGQNHNTNGNNVKRIKNIFPTGKLNIEVPDRLVSTVRRDKVTMRHLDLGVESHSQGTQTKQLNSSRDSSLDSSVSSPATPSVSDHVNRNTSNDDSQQRKFNVVISTTRDCATQIPVHIRDQAIQTSFTSNIGEWSFFIKRNADPANAEQEMDKELSSTQSKEKGHSKFYICYPNYSLPDLGFLKTMQGSLETPELVCMPSAKCSHTEKPTVRRRTRSSENRSRPKSFNDFETLSRVKQVEDWDSLSVLLPKGLKEMIKKIQQAEPEGDGGTPKLSGNCTPPPPLPKRSLSLATDSQDYSLFPKGILRKPLYPYQKSHVSRTDEVRSKRFSLQEPFHKLPADIPELGSTSLWLPESTNQFLSHNHPCSHLENHSILVRTASDGDSGRGSERVESRSDLLSNQEWNLHNSDPVTNTSSNHIPHCSCLRHKKTVSFYDDLATQEFPEYQQKENEESPCLCGTGTGEQLADNIYVSAHQERIQKMRADQQSCCIQALHSKTGIVQNLHKAVEHVVKHFKEEKLDDAEKHQIGVDVVQRLCPAIYGILSDGLLPEVPGLLCPVPNSVWLVVEASVSQTGEKKGFKDLFQRVCEEKILTDHNQRFSAFLLGLLNLGWLHTWLSHLLCSTSIIYLHYHPFSLLKLLTMSSAICYQRQLVGIVQTLAQFSFSLELTLAITCSTEAFNSAVQQQKFESDTICWSGTTVYPFGQEDIGEKENNASSNPESNTQEGKHFQQLRQRWELLTRNSDGDGLPSKKGQTQSRSSQNPQRPDSLHHFPDKKFLADIVSRLPPSLCADTCVPASKLLSPDAPKPNDSKLLCDGGSNFPHLDPSVKLRKNYSGDSSEKPNATGIPILATGNQGDGDRFSLPSSVRRRSLIPVHKKASRTIPRRSGSAPAEREHR